MDDPFLEVYERAAEGDVEGARARLSALREAGADPDRIADLQAFLDASEGEAAPLARAHGDVTHPGRGLGHGPVRDAVPFRCLVCGVEEHIVRPVVLNRRVTTFFGFDMVDRSATTYACTGCGHIAWFGRAAPGFVQAWADEDAARLEIEGGKGTSCRLCGFGALQSSKALLNTSLLTFLGLDWLDEGARTQRCVRCGMLHWSATRPGAPSPWRSKDPQTTDRCPACNGPELHAHKALLNTRAATAVGLDWLDRPAWVMRCADCHAMTWWARRPQSTTE